MRNIKERLVLKSVKHKNNEDPYIVLLEQNSRVIVLRGKNMGNELIYQKRTTRGIRTSVEV